MAPRSALCKPVYNFKLTVCGGGLFAGLSDQGAYAVGCNLMY